MNLVNDLVHLSYSSVPNYSELMVGVPTDYKEIKTLRDLLAINYKSASIEQQIRGNLVSKIESGQNPYRGIIGYDDDVIPALNRALLSGNDLPNPLQRIYCPPSPLSEVLLLTTFQLQFPKMN